MQGAAYLPRQVTFRVLAGNNARSTGDDGQSSSDEKLEDKHQLERDRLEFEKEKAKKEAQQKDAQLALKAQEMRTWRNPTLVAAVVVALFSLLGNILLFRENSDLEASKAARNSELEQRKAEMSGAFDVMKQIEPQKGIERLSVLIDLGLYHDQGQVKNYLQSEKASTVPPGAAAAPTGTAKEPSASEKEPSGAAKEPSGVKKESSGAAITSTVIRVPFQARSNGGTFIQCKVPHDNHHFESWHIEKQTSGAADAWFTKQDKTELCVRADAVETSSGRNSRIDAVLVAVEVPN
jgi:hypothetical protein